MKKKGFTLIELLVVIAVIALLMAVLTPALKKAKMSAKKLICKSNLHTWGTVVHAYAESQNQRFPRQDIGPSGMNAWDVSNRLMSYDNRGRFGHYNDNSGKSLECVTYDYGIDDEDFAWCPMIPAKEKDLVVSSWWCSSQGETSYGMHHYNLWIGYSWWVPRGADNNDDGQIDYPKEMFPWNSNNTTTRELIWPEGAVSKGANHPIMTDVVLRLPPEADNFGLADNPEVTTDLALASINAIGKDVLGFHQLNGLLRDVHLLYADGSVDTNLNQGDNIRPRFWPSLPQYRNMY